MVEVVTYSDPVLMGDKPELHSLFMCDVSFHMIGREFEGGGDLGRPGGCG